MYGIFSDRLQSLPDTYLGIARAFNLFEIAVGRFILSPAGRYNNLKEALIDSNIIDPFFPLEFMEKHRMYQIGSCNTDLICVTGGAELFIKGEVLYVEEGYDIYNPQDKQIQPIAKDFEQF